MAVRVSIVPPAARVNVPAFVIVLVLMTTTPGVRVIVPTSIAPPTMTWLPNELVNFASAFRVSLPPIVNVLLLTTSGVLWCGAVS
ncbi:hypothetical protein ACVW0I_000963 [Bradyrhizobium sp. LM6.11]